MLSLQHHFSKKNISEVCSQNICLFENNILNIYKKGFFNNKNTNGVQLCGMHFCSVVWSLCHTAENHVRENTSFQESVQGETTQDVTEDNKASKHVWNYEPKAKILLSATYIKGIS